jgi:hypothetical protein
VKLVQGIVLVGCLTGCQPEPISDVGDFWLPPEVNKTEVIKPHSNHKEAIKQINALQLKIDELKTFLQMEDE